MEIRDHLGLRLALVTPRDLTDRPWTREPRPPDVVRLVEPPESCWPLLTGRGFVRKPARVTWIAPLCADEDLFLRRLDRKARQDLHRAQRRAGSLTMHVEESVEPGRLDPFLRLYAAQVAMMRYGDPIAVRLRADILSATQRHFAVYAYDGPDLVGGCIAAPSPELDMVRVRFSAVTGRWRANGLARCLYLSAMRIARRMGFTWISLGTEPNLYGHVVKPGLLTFKAALGFVPRPSQDFADPAAADEADMVHTIGALSEPSAILGYTDPHDVGDRTLTLHLFTAGSGTPVLPGAPSTAPPVVHRVLVHHRETLPARPDAAPSRGAVTG